MLLDLPLIFKALQNACVVVGLAFLATQLPAFRRMFASPTFRLKDKIVLALFFGAFSALGTYMNIQLLNSLMASRLVGVVVGGLLGGPFVGLMAGAIGAVARYSLGGFTMWAAIISNLAIGCFAGFVNTLYGTKRIDIKIAFVTLLIAELIHKTMILTISKPFAAALALEKAVAIPTTVANSLGVVLFFYIIRETLGQQEKLQAKSAQNAMQVICHTNGLLRDGLNEKSALLVAEAIHVQTGAAAVAITNLDYILAFVGQGNDHHLAGDRHSLASTKLVLEQRKTVISNDKHAISCSHEDCPLTAVVDAPLIVDQELLGSIKIFKTGKDVVTLYEAELIQGIADFLSLQLLQLKLSEQGRLRARAEYQMLKAQINPHFLYNTLGTIRALVLKKPDTARVLIKDLAVFMRKTLNRTDEIVTLSEELEFVRNYLRIEKARFGERISVVEKIPRELLNEPVLAFTLQPLVENAVNHGLFPLKEGGTIWISAWNSPQGRFIEVKDDGSGIAEEKLARLLRAPPPDAPGDTQGIGLDNVNRRLQSMFGDRFGLHIQSREGHGTQVLICLPHVFPG